MDGFDSFLRWRLATWLFSLVSVSVGTLAVWSPAGSRTVDHPLEQFSVLVRFKKRCQAAFAPSFSHFLPQWAAVEFELMVSLR